MGVTIPELYDQSRISFNDSLERDAGKLRAQIKQLYPVMNDQSHQFALVVQTLEESKGDLAKAANIWFQKGK